MPLNDTFANDLAKLIFWGTAIADLAENDGSSPLTSLYIALHTADPGAAGAQNANECSYGSYARVAVTRDSGGFAIAGRVVTFVANVDFPVCASGPETATHFSIGVASSGASKILARGTLTPNIAIIVGGTPRVKTDSTITWL